MSARNATWTGASGSDSDWSTKKNWDTSTAPVNGDALFFAGTTRLTNNDDLTLQIIGLTFNSGAGAFTLSGNSVTLGGNVTNSSSNLQTINLGLTLQQTTQFDTGSAGITIGGVISGSTFGVTKIGTGTLTLSGTDTYTGGTNVQNGTVVLGTGGSLAASNSLTLGNSTTSGIFQLGDGSGAVNTTVTSLTTSGTGTANAVVGGNAGNSTLTVNNSTADTYSGVLGGSGTNQNNLALTKTGAGTLTLSGANTYSGGTTISAGILRMSGSGTLGNSAGTLTMNGGELDLNGTNQNVGALNGSSGTILNELPGTNTLTVGNGNTSGSFSGTITDHDGLGSGFVKLVKTGTGTETMTSTTSNYTGGTDVNQGVLISNSSNGGALGRGPINVNNGGKLAGSGTIDPAASITVNSGGTLMPGSTASPGSIAKLNTGSVTLKSGSTFAVDLNAGAGPTGTGAGTIYDQVSVTGTITLAGTLSVNPGAGLAVGDKFFIMLNDGTDAVSGGFSNAPTTGSTFTAGSDVFLIDYVDNGDLGVMPNDISLTVTAIPEPGTWVAAALMLGAIGYWQLQLRKPSRAGSRSPARDESPSDPPNFTSSLARGISLNNRSSVASYRLPGVASQTSNVRGYTS